MSILSRISDRIDRYLQERKELAELRRREIERQERIREYHFGMGNDFEDTVVRMFDPSVFELIHRTPRYDEAHGRYVRGMELPDLRFREISTGRKFWVECKYRSRFEPDWSIEWCLRSQLTAYKRTSHEYRGPVLIVIGVGGTVEKPDKVYCLDLDRINFTTLYYGTFKENRVYWEMPKTLDGLLEVANRTRPYRSYSIEGVRRAWRYSVGDCSGREGRTIGTRSRSYVWLKARRSSDTMTRMVISSYRRSMTTII